jgi:sarcosine oxidase subunit gamma
MRATWGKIGDAPIAVRFRKTEEELAAMQVLGLCDLSSLAKLGVKGPRAAEWLVDQNVPTPEAIYDSDALEDGGLVIRLGGNEFMLESGVANRTVPALSAKLIGLEDGVYRVQREEATFVLIGSRSLDVLARTSSVNFRESAPRRLVLTRVAAVNCGVFSDPRDGLPAFRLWVDASYAVYLWETLVEMCVELGGQPIGAACLYPELG